MTTTFPPRPAVTAHIAGSDERFPVSRIFCVGRNYAEHAREMGRDPDREPPFFFLKNADAYAPSGSELPYPPQTGNFHHEIELVVAIGQDGFEVSERDALSLVYGYAVGLDMTRRDLQLQARDMGRPWCTGKNFPLSAPMAAIRPMPGENFPDGAISLTVNGAVRQYSNTSKLIWSVGEIIAHLTKLYRLSPGDLIFTGTPEGVGPVVSGDRLVGMIDGLEPLAVTIAAPR